MIRISNSIVDPDTFIQQYPRNSIQRIALRILSESSKVYDYASPTQLYFEVDLRNSIVAASRDLYRSRLSFQVFRNARCNPKYWELTEEGGFLLKDGAVPSEAIRDIYINTPKYGTECSTAIVIVYYKALVEIFPEELFNRLFSSIYLMNWMHLDRNLGIVHYRDIADYLPGDCRYFKNPDVDPQTPEWQGENAIDMGDGTYYGHGIGITTAGRIIDALNRRRAPGSDVSAYLMESATRPNFRHLSNIRDGLYTY